MKKYLLTRLLILLAINPGWSQNEKNLVGKFTFNNKSLINEISGKPVKALGKSFVSDRFGNENSAVFLYGGLGSYINLGTDDELKPVRGTVSVWINIENIIYRGQGIDVNPVILTKNTSVDDFHEGYCLMYHYDTHRFSASAGLDQQNQVCVFSESETDLRKWRHLIMTFDDDSLHFYIDGILQACIVKTFKNAYLKGDSVMVGNTANKKNSRYFNGLVDDIYIYDRVLSSSEVKQLYEQPNPNRTSIVLKWIFAFTGSALGIFFIVLFFVKRQKRIFKKENEQIDLKTRLREMETKAIRLQMNPHFIFNTLNSLQRIILEGDISKANDYLSKFSVMLRRILESYDSDNISLKEELEILEIYINIEKVRFGNSFEYTIHSDVKNPAAVFIPFMLIQPIIENAIWHGLLPKEGEKKLAIAFTDNIGFITCKVEDNGVGINAEKHEPLLTNRKRSMALEFIKQRLSILTEVTLIKGAISITSKRNKIGKNEGTLVELRIPKR
ncbi:hypothetical protein CNR22_21060 [Sphingobacteriaceae bacterium]|nr:hypothetical protein CNR22_21060 [Sphingobacteriaceae bacterium]